MRHNDKNQWHKFYDPRWLVECVYHALKTGLRRFVRARQELAVENEILTLVLVCDLCRLIMLRRAVRHRDPLRRRARNERGRRIGSVQACAVRPEAAEEAVKLGESGMVANYGTQSTKGGVILCVLALGEPVVLWHQVLANDDQRHRFIANLAVAQFPPAPIDESYGEFLNDPRAQHSANRWLFAEGNGMWRDDVDGKLDPSGTVFAGTFKHSGNGFVIPGPQPFRWERISGTCGDLL
jgi:hypothetical protein